MAPFLVQVSHSYIVSGGKERLNSKQSYKARYCNVINVKFLIQTFDKDRYVGLWSYNTVPNLSMPDNETSAKEFDSTGTSLFFLCK